MCVCVCERERERDTSTLQAVGDKPIYNICSTQFVDLRNLEIALRIWEIAKMRANFEIVLKLLRNLEIAQEHPGVLPSLVPRHDRG